MKRTSGGGLLAHVLMMLPVLPEEGDVSFCRRR